MIHKLWMSLFMIGIIYSLVSGNIDAVNQAILQGANSAITLVLSLAGILVFWTGILEVANKAKMLDLLSFLLMPIMKLLYPRLGKDHPAIKFLTTNMISNLLGLSSIATGAGIKAIEALQDTNPNKKKPSFEMYTLVILNKVSLALIPTTVFTLRSTLNAISPTDVYIPILMAGGGSPLVGLILHNIWSRIKKVQSSSEGVYKA